ncbi:unnamed protein product, partial [Arabidopsis lyrata]
VLLNYAKSAKEAEEDSKQVIHFPVLECNLHYSCPKYRVELDVHDGEHGTTFVILDKEMRKLTNKTATTIMDEKGNKGNNNILPTCLSDLAGKHFRF